MTAHGPRRPSGPPFADMLVWPNNLLTEFRRRVAELEHLGHTHAAAQARAFEQVRPLSRPPHPGGPMTAPAPRPSPKAALDAFHAAAHALADATAHEMELEHLKPIRKHAAIANIMSSAVNPLTNKPHSFSSAELLAETDPEYAQHLADLRQAVAARILAAAEARAAELLAELLVRATPRAA